MLTEYGFDFNTFVYSYIGANLEKIERAEGKSKRGRKPSDRNKLVSLLALTNERIKDQLELTGGTPVSIMAARKRNKNLIMELSKGVAGAIVCSMLTTAVKRVQEGTTLISLPDTEQAAKTADLEREMQNEKIPEIRADKLAPHLFFQVVEFVCAFIGGYREIQKLLQTGFIPAEHHDLLHTLAVLWSTVVRDNNLTDKWAADNLSLVILELYIQVAIPLIRAFQEKVETDYRRMKSAVDWDRQIDIMLESAKAGMTDYMVEWACDYAKVLKDAPEEMHKKIVDIFAAFRNCIERGDIARKKGDS